MVKLREKGKAGYVKVHAVDAREIMLAEPGKFEIVVKKVALTLAERAKVKEIQKEEEKIRKQEQIKAQIADVEKQKLVDIYEELSCLDKDELDRLRDLSEEEISELKELSDEDIEEIREEFSLDALNSDDEDADVENGIADLEDDEEEEEFGSSGKKA